MMAEMKQLYSACESNNSDLVQRLLQSGTDINSKGPDGATPLYAATKKGHIDIVTVLLQHKADINSQDDNGTSPLYIAAKKGHKNIVSLLLQHKADVNSRRTDGSSPLYIASEKGHKDCVDVLLEHGADVNLQDMNRASPLYRAAKKGHIDILEVLLQKGADINSQRANGESPLHIALKNGHIETVKVLLKHRANVSLSDKRGATVLSCAAMLGQAAVVGKLLDHKPNKNSQDENGQTPLMMACSRNHLEVVRLLCNNGADVNTQDNDGNTSLHLVISNNSQKITKVLLHYGAKLIANKDGLTPLDIAKEKQYTAIIAALQGDQLEDEPDMPQTYNQDSNIEIEVARQGFNNLSPYAEPIFAWPTNPKLDNEISKHYDDCHQMFDNRGLFHREVAAEFCMNIAAYTLEDPTFPVDRVSSQVVNSLPCSVITNGHKELIFMKSFTLKEALCQSRDPQKLRHLIVSVFHLQPSLYSEMETIHSHYTKQHLIHNRQTSGPSPEKHMQWKPIEHEEYPQGQTIETPLINGGTTAQTTAQLNEERLVHDNAISQEIKTEMVHKGSTAKVKERETVDQSFLDLFKGIKKFEISNLQLDRNQFLGRGTYGHVYSVEWLGTTYALKDIPIPRNKKPYIDASIVNEIQVSAAIEHPSVVKFIGYSLNIDRNSSSIFIVYELIEGQDLEKILNDDEMIHEFDFNTDKVKYKAMVDIASALAFLHYQKPDIIIHGDVKPANVMLSKDGQAKLCDLGLGKIKQSYSETKSESGEGGFGTPSYMAPEVLLQKKTSSRSTDVYSYGATLYHVMFNESLWDIDKMVSTGPIKFYYGPSKDPRELLKQKVSREKLPKKLKDNMHPAIKVITKCVQFDRSDRPTSREVLDIMKKLYETASHQVSSD